MVPLLHNLGFIAATCKMPIAQHILSYAQTLDGGGVERALLRLARGWVMAGRRVTLVIGSDTGPLADEVPVGVETIVLGTASRRALRRLPSIVAAHRPDMIFCPGNHYTSLALWIALRLGKRCPPIVAKVSNAPTRGDHGRLMGAAHHAWLRLHPRFIDRLVAMTPAMAAETIALMGIAADRVSVIANPPAMPIPGAPPVRLPEGRYILGAGRLAPQKRWDRLIAAIPHLADRTIPLAIVGEGPDRAKLEAQVHALGLAGRVSFPGHAIDPLPAIGGAALVALTSDFEGVPGVLREALAAGTPVVSTNSSTSIAEIVSDTSLGTIVPRDDQAALVAAIDRWLVPDAIRPAPVPQPGEDSAARYLALFDALTALA